MRRFVEQAAREGVELILFPVCCISGYWPLRKLDRAALLELAEPIPDSGFRMGRVSNNLHVGRASLA
jgi:predicted amidohydrolase